MLFTQILHICGKLKKQLKPLLVIACMCLCLDAFAQDTVNNILNKKMEPDTSYSKQADLRTADQTDSELENQLEEITIHNEEYIDFIDLIEESNTNRLININTANEKLLRGLGLNNEQINNIRKYITEYGELSSIYELNLVEGFDSTLIAGISPHIQFVVDREMHKLTTKNLLTRGKQKIVFRINHNLQTPKAYQGDTAAYIGNPDKMLIRYNYSYYDRLKIGVTLEKDAGEKMPDYIGWHIYYGSKKIFKDFVLGSYNVTIGQGLSMNSSYGFSKAFTTSPIINSLHSVRASSGANENFGLNGLATTLRLPLNSELTLFYSYKRLDGSKSIDSTDKAEFINTIYETGLHRTTKELKTKGSITSQVYGISLSKRIRNLSLGIITHQTLLQANTLRKDQPYRIFDFHGNRLTIGGFYAGLNLNTIEFFGETSVNLQSPNYAGNKKGIAGLVGLNMNPSGNTGVTILYRNFSPQYQNFYSSTFSESTSTNNEEGIFFGINSLLSRRVGLSVYADFFRFPWLKYRVDGPSVGREYMVNVKLRINSREELAIKYVYKNRMQNEVFNEQTPGILFPYLIANNDSLVYLNNPGLINFPKAIESHSFRFTLLLNPAHNLQLRSRIDYNFVDKENGFLIAQDLIYKPTKEQFQLYLRYALFDIDSFDSRIYAYENDVLNSFTIPVFTDKGSRFYCMTKISYNRFLDFWVRYAFTLYPGKTSIGQGMDEISGDRKSEIKIQIILHL
jgi:DNA uptake protein ComE-like DNA-binding protein